MLRKFLTLTFFLVSATSLVASWKDDYITWVMDRQDWNLQTREFLQQNPKDADAQILKRYLRLFLKNASIDLMPVAFNQFAAEQAVEYCPAGVADLQYVLTGTYPTGPCILILLNESHWLEHLGRIQERITEKMKQEIA